MTTGNPDHTSNELSIKDLIIKTRLLFLHIKSKWQKVLLFAFIGAAMGLIYSFVKKPQYTAGMTFTVEGEDQSTGGINGLAAQFGFDIGGGKGSIFEGDNIMVFFKSRSMVQKTLLTEDSIAQTPRLLVDDYINYNDYRKRWDNKPALSNVVFTPGQQKLSRLQDSILSVFYDEIIKKNLFVDKVDKKLSIVTLNFTGKNELFAKSFVERLAGNVIDFYIQSRIRKSQYNVDILQHQVDSVKRKLNEAISGVASSTDAEPNANPLKQVLRVSSQKKIVDVEESKAVLTELVKNLEISKVSLLKDRPLIEIIDQPILPLKKEKISKTMGIIAGFIIGAFLAVMVIVIKRIYHQIMA